MRFLADENFPKPLVEFRRAEGHDVLWSGTDLQAPKDAALLDFAESEGRILSTLDKDFWQIALQRRVPLRKSGVVLFRAHPTTPATLYPLTRAFVKAGRTWAGDISSAIADGIQMIAGSN
jgi:predicted nuclease of predicted toxin-antitoxin system